MTKSSDQAEDVIEREADKPQESPEEAAQREADDKAREEEVLEWQSLGPALARLSLNCRAAGHEFTEVFVKAAQNAFGIDIR